MSKTNITPSPATQSVPASNELPIPAASKPPFNYAAAAARSSSSSRPIPPSNSNSATSTPLPPFASTVVATSSISASTSPNAKPSSRISESASTAPRPINGSSSAIKSSLPPSERKTSVVSVKAHNIKPSSSNIHFGSLADPKADTTGSVLSSSPANPPLLSQRDGPPMFGSVSTDAPKRAANPPSSVASATSKTGAPVSSATSGPASKGSKRNIDFQAFFRSGGETVSHPPAPPASSGSSPSPSNSYRPDPTSNRRNPSGFDPSASLPNAPPPVSPRPAHLAISGGTNNGGSFHSPLSGASRAFTPGQGSPMSQPPPPSSQQSHYGPAAGHWPGQGAQTPNSPHFIPGNPPHNSNVTSYPHSNGAIVGTHGNHQQFLQKPQGFPHRNSSGAQNGNSSSSMYPPNGRSNIHHTQRSGMPAPPSPRMPHGNPPNGTQSPGYQHHNTQGMQAPYWPSAHYQAAGPGPSYSYMYNPSVMPTYPHSNNFPPPPPPSQHGQNSSPQLSNQPGPSAPSQPGPPLPPSTVALPSSAQRPHQAPAVPSPVTSSPVPASNTYAPPYPSTVLYSPSSGHSRGPSLSYNAATFTPVLSPDFKHHIPNAAASPFQPRRSAAVAIKKPITPASSGAESAEKLEEPLQVTDISKDAPPISVGKAPVSGKSSLELAQPKSSAEVSVTKPPVDELKQVAADKPEALNSELSEKKVEQDGLGKKRLADEHRAVEEAVAQKKAQEQQQERQTQAKIIKEAKEAQEAKEKAEREQREKAERAEREAKETAEREEKETAEREEKETAEREAKLQRDREEKERLEREQQARKALEAMGQAKQQANLDKPAETSLSAGSGSAPPVQTSEPTDLPASDSSSRPVQTESSPLPTAPESASVSLPGLPSKPVNGACLPPSNSKNRPTPIDVNAVPQHKRDNSTSETLTPSLPSALSSARKIEDLGQVSYPDNIQSPRSDLNPDATPGKFRYDRAFLLQFMEVCKGKPVQLPDLDSIGMVDSHNFGTNPMSRTQSSGGQRRNTNQMSSGRGPSGSLTPSGGSMPMMGPGSLSNRTGPGAGMPMFATGTNRTSEERFHQSNRPALGAMPIGSGLMLPGRPTGQMSRTPSSNALPPMMSNGARDSNRRSARGSRRDGGGTSSNVGGHNPNMNRALPLQQMFEVVQPLQPSANSWAASRSNQLEEDSPEMVNRKVKGLLNKLTLDKFDSISDQVIQWANKSQKESDGRILRQVIALIFEKATDEAHWSEMYAKLCQKLMQKLSLDVKDENVLDNNGNKVHGGHLFRKYLLNRCQEDYERGWSKRDELAAAAADKAADDAVKQAANEKSRAEAKAEGKEEPSKEFELLSDEYYAAQKAKRQGLGLVRFIGELYKLGMLTERIMHECIKKLLSNIDTPEEEDIESLCRLMMTAGEMLDHEKAVSHMNVYFSRMGQMAENISLSSRTRFMLQDVIDTRKNTWIGRNVVAGPKLISQIHEEAAQAAAEQSRQSQANKNMGKMHDLTRGGSRGGRNRDQMGGPTGDGWLSVGGSAPPPRPSKAGDLTQFGKLRDTSSSGRPTFGPSSVFANKGKPKDVKVVPEREPVVAVASNPFAALRADTGEGNNTPATLIRKASVPEMAPTGRPRLNLAPRTLPLPGQNTSTGQETEDKSLAPTLEASETKEEADIPDELANRLITNSIEEFIQLRSVSEGVQSFASLAKPRCHQLVRRLVEKVMDRKAADVDLTASLFQELSAGALHRDVFMKGFGPVVEQLDDTAVDVRYAYEYCAKLMKASRLSEENVLDLASKMDAEDVKSATQRLIEAFGSSKLE